MKQHIQIVIAKYHAQGILLDTNLLLVYCIGAINPQYIPRFKRTRAYLAEDFTLLSQLMKRFTTFVTTPNILTEVSNLANSLPGEYHLKFQQIFSQLVPTFSEEYQESKQLVTQIELLKFGLTDAGIITLVKERFLVVTDDFPLSQYLQRQGIDVLNFNHIRSLAW